MAASSSILRLLGTVFWEDKTLKLVCFVLAILSYFYIDGELSDEREFAVAVREASIKLPDNLEFAPDNKFPVALRVRVRGPRRRLQYVSSENIKLDLKDAVPKLVPGDNRIVVRPEDVEVAGVSEMRIQKVEPADGFPVRLLAVSKRMLPVKVRRQGNPPPGFQLTGTIVQPREVLVSSTADLSQADVVWTEPVDLSGRTENFQLPAVRIAPGITIGDRDVEIRCNETVTVTLQVHREEITRTIENVPVRALAPPGATMFADPANVTVTVTGLPDEIATLGAADIQLYVEWPADWDLQQPQGHAFPSQNAQVKAAAPSRIKVLGENKQPLPAVKVRGVLTAAPQ
ncbi:MAG: YbbR-like domain-containing protein [Planctomycetes bacterium]|nr:YbbR-like domain-containing protein [Planctomycetota bacterium]